VYYISFLHYNAGGTLIFLNYKEPSIISGTGVIWSKLTLGLLATITLEVVSLYTYAPFPALVIF
jgi:hypothetical protein